MRFLPIVERELREASRQAKTWWRRVWILALGLVVFGFAVMLFGRFTTSSALGKELFNTLVIFGLFLALLAGPLTTADCVSRERRQGTLGLLFLTDLGSYDIVFGKLVAASLAMVLGLAALAPLAALPFLMGGLSLRQFWFATLTLADILVLSLAVGMFASTMVSSARAALAITLGILLFLTLGLPLVVDGMGVGRSHLGAMYRLCPSYTTYLALDVAPRRGGGTGLWYNLLSQQTLAWALLWFACRRTGRVWHETGEQPSSSRRWPTRGMRRLSAARLRWRSAMLDHNPVAWVEGRDVLQDRTVWGICLGAAVLLAGKHLLSPGSWPTNDWIITWGISSQYVLCLWLGIQAPRRMADDKESGALELLLCTPTSEHQIVKGNFMVLQRRFGRGMLVLLALDVFLVHAYQSLHGGWDALGYNPRDSFLTLALYGLIVFPIQGWSIARISLYEGLVHSWRATFIVLAKVGLLPWVLFFAFVITWEALAHHFRFRGVNDSSAFATWAVMHLVCCLVFVTHAQWQLRRNFRLLAATTYSLPWWKRFWAKRATAAF